jgi:flagellar basal body-associated protein FliL
MWKQNTVQIIIIIIIIIIIAAAAAAVECAYMYPTLVNNAQASCLCSGMYLARKASTMVH